VNQAIIPELLLAQPNDYAVSTSSCNVSKGILRATKPELVSKMVEIKIL
jgi:hypothetical protein